MPVPRARPAVNRALLDRRLGQLTGAAVRPELIGLLKERIVEGSDDQLTGMRPLPEGEDGLVLRLLESHVHGGPAEFRCVRNPIRGVTLDARGGILMETSASGDAVSFDTAPCDLVQLRVDFS